METLPIESVHLRASRFSKRQRFGESSSLARTHHEKVGTERTFRCEWLGRSLYSVRNVERESLLLAPTLSKNEPPELVTK